MDSITGILGSGLLWVFIMGDREAFCKPNWSSYYWFSDGPLFSMLCWYEIRTLAPPVAMTRQLTNSGDDITVQ